MVYTLVPLGNPGKAYEQTRHNAARLVLEEIKNDLSFCEVFVPETFMNESGLAVLEYLRYHNERELVVMYDDKDLPLGTIRISYDRGDGGHNGVKSIIEQLGTRAFIRLRIGIAGNDEFGNVQIPQGDDVQRFVMGKFLDSELLTLRKSSLLVLNSLRDIVELGYQKAMEKNN